MTAPIVRQSASLPITKGSDGRLVCSCCGSPMVEIGEGLYKCEIRAAAENKVQMMLAEAVARAIGAARLAETLLGLPSDKGHGKRGRR